MDEKLEELLTSLGSLSEMCWIFYNNLKNQGFDSLQALQLTSTFLANGIKGGRDL